MKRQTAPCCRGLFVFCDKNGKLIKKYINQAEKFGLGILLVLAQKYVKIILELFFGKPSYRKMTIKKAPRQRHSKELITVKPYFNLLCYSECFQNQFMKVKQSLKVLELCCSEKNCY